MDGRYETKLGRLFNYSCSTIFRAFHIILYGGIIIFLSGCTGTWIWQEDYPKHRTMSLKCPQWNYDEAYDKLHHIYTTRQHEPIEIKK